MESVRRRIKRQTVAHPAPLPMEFLRRIAEHSLYRMEHPCCDAVQLYCSHDRITKDAVVLCALCGVGTMVPYKRYTDCKCGGIGADAHHCPYKLELNNDDEPCNCCEDCMANCAEDI